MIRRWSTLALCCRYLLIFQLSLFWHNLNLSLARTRRSLDPFVFLASMSPAWISQVSLFDPIFIPRFFGIQISTFSLYPDQKDDQWRMRCQYQCSGRCSDYLTEARVCREKSQATTWLFLSVYQKDELCLKNGWKSQCDDMKFED
jgi:hypothetical protein